MNSGPEPYREGVNIIFEDRMGRVAIQLRDDLPGVVYGGYWGLFGGWLEAGENPYETAVREAREELSIDIDPAQLVFIGVYMIDVIRARDYIFRCPVNGELDSAQLNEGEAFRFASRAELRAEKMVPYHLDLLEWYWSGLPPEE